MIKLKPKDLRTMTVDPEIFKKLKKNPVYLIVDNVLDTYNVGAIFRLADAAAVTEVILCGATERPPHTRIKKASINTTEWVKWSYFADTKDAINHLRDTVPGIQIVAVEQDQKSVQYGTYDYTFPIALIAGHETDGVSREVMDLCDAIVEIPMWGVNVSLNVMVSLGIVLFKVMENIES